MNDVSVEFFYAEPMDGRDVRSIQRLISELSQSREPFGKQEIAETANSHVLFVARTERGAGKVVGLCIVIPVSKFGRKKIFVEDVVVAAKFRGHGIGRAIIKKVIWYAKATGCYGTDLTTRSAHLEANKLYQSVGFEKRNMNCYRWTAEPD